MNAVFHAEVSCESCFLFEHTVGVYDHADLKNEWHGFSIPSCGLFLTFRGKINNWNTYTQNITYMIQHLFAKEDTYLSCVGLKQAWTQIFGISGCMLLATDTH